MNTLPASRIRLVGEGPPVVLVHGSLTAEPWDDDWAKQHSLAEHYQLRVLTRRGYGDTRPVQSRDFEMDVRDIIEALGEGAHLVGHSYGGAMSLLAAARRPDLVRSLAVIEPPVFGVVRGNPDVERILGRLIPLWNSAGSLTPEEFFQSFRGAIAGKPPATSHVELTPLDIKGIEATVLERPSWEVEVPLHELADAQFPKLVFSGSWSPAFDAVCDVLEQQAGFERVIIQGGGHAVSLTGEPFTRRLVEFLESIKA